MRRIFLQLSIFLLFPSLFFWGCKKEQLPKATQSGANTFGFKIDGVVFKPYYAGGLLNNVNVLSAGNSQNQNLFSIGAANQQTDQSISIEFTYLTQVGTYQLRRYPFRGIYTGSYNTGGWYTTDSVNTGELIITRCDNVNKIYSGTVSFTGKDQNTGKNVRTTEGRFDIKE